MISPLPCSGVMICSKCSLIIPGRRYRLPGGVILSPLRSEGIRQASKQLIEATTSLQSIRQARCVSDLSRARSIPCIAAVGPLGPYCPALNGWHWVTPQSRIPPPKAKVQWLTQWLAKKCYHCTPIIVRDH